MAMNPGMHPALKVKKIPSKYQPKGFRILYEDDHLIVGNKAAGFLTVGALYERERTIHQALNQYVRKGNSRSHKVVFVVHRLDRETSGLLMFAKSDWVKDLLKDNWKGTTKTYYAIVHGRMAQKTGTFSSYLQEDEDYVMHSSRDPAQGKLSATQYTVVKETGRFTLVRINLLTGRKNQVRVHFADAGHPVVGDMKYGPSRTKYPRLALHAQALSFTHPVTHQPLNFETPLPQLFSILVP
jgi:tRNA pseudouridine32 synthase/23S rRNA pseudouridine746 synthase/23S rRNA pseudouridine1911/1915/1917 synthase